ncbi:MAG: hypothetical protein FWD03_08620 [Defluviitaleaceae bacterium]|nr:hypothetical protein [Defluviitaleaceae bacterium]
MNPTILPCKTKYPILLLHGTGARDRSQRTCWGRIPHALQNAGTEIYYGNQDAWGTVESNAQMIKETALSILAKTGCEKINIIAISKGGLEARYMVSKLEMGDKIASVTTISTPHHGSRTMDFFSTDTSRCLKSPPPSSISPLAAVAIKIPIYTASAINLPQPTARNLTMKYWIILRYITKAMHPL